MPRQPLKSIGQTLRDLFVSKRLPRPAKPTRPRCEIDEAELKAIEDAAHACRLSVAAFVRVALIESAAHPERVEEWLRLAQAIIDGSPQGQAKPGRPPKGKKGKKGSAS